jgi:CelD/BcsL family acetyltransferase involved in cellulose biosynthesis
MSVETDLEIESPPESGAWDELVRSAPDSTVFHTSAWARLWTEEWKDARWEAVLVEEEGKPTGGLAWIVRRRGLLETVDSMPFATYGGPLVVADHPDPVSVRSRLLGAFARRTSKRLVVRSQLTWYEGHPAELPDMVPVEEGFTHVLPLSSDYERVAERFSSSARRLVRQADESGLSIRPAETIEDVRTFIAIAEETVRRRGGTPKRASLYERIFHELVPAGLGRYHLVEHEGEAVAGSLHLFHEGVATSWLPVSKESSWPLRPNNYLVAAMLETLCAAGYFEYNFGASPKGADGLIRFKEGWGADPRPVVIAARRSALHRRLRP